MKFFIITKLPFLWYTKQLINVWCWKKMQSTCGMPNLGWLFAGNVPPTNIETKKWYKESVDWPKC